MKAAYVAAGLVALKATILAADSTIRLYLGDSAAYLYGAMDDGRLPDDWSFTYSFLIRWLVYPFASLWPLPWWQSLAGVATAWLLWRTLERRFAVPRVVSVAAAGVLALEPAQLYYERMVLAETFGLAAFALFFAACCAYLAEYKARWLVAAAVFGLIAVTLRLNYVPVVLVISLVLPLLPLVSRNRPSIASVRRHAALAFVAVATLHGAYCLWVGWIFHKPPGYLGRAGFMRLGLVLPLVTSEHLTRVGLPADFGAQLQYPIADPHARMPHLWLPGGLVRELRNRKLDVDDLARRLSRMAVADDPLGVVRLGFYTVGDYFRDDEIKNALENDLGRHEIPAEILWSLREEWGYDATGLPTRVTLVSRAFELTTWWLVACLLTLPLVAVANLLVHWHTAQRQVALLAALFGVGLVLAHLLFVPVALYRYLHPLPFFLLINTVPLAFRRTVKESADGSESQ